MLIQIILAILIFLTLWITFSYNSLTRTSNQLKNSFAGIDVQLKKRNDLIPNLIEIVKGYAKHEKQIIQEITQARVEMMNFSKKQDIKGLAKEEDTIENCLKSIFALRENYPKLQANTTFLELQEKISKIEEQISASRRIYNSNVMYLNNKIQTFPKNIIANIFGFKEGIFFQATDSERQKINVGFNS